MQVTELLIEDPCEHQNWATSAALAHPYGFQMRDIINGGNLLLSLAKGIRWVRDEVASQDCPNLDVPNLILRSTSYQD